MVVGVNDPKKEIKVQNLTHPEYDASVMDWQKYRLAYESGRAFVDKYLRQFSSRENGSDFDVRKDIAYVPSHAKAAINDVKNAIYQRMVDITRKGGPVSYQGAITGNRGGVDLDGNSMNGFIGRIVLPELLIMAKVGIFVDKPRLDGLESLMVQQSVRPYVYMYTAEQIRSWAYNNENILTCLLLEDKKYDIESEWGVMYKELKGYRLLQLTDQGVLVRFFNQEGAEHQEPVLLNLTRIPFVIGDLGTSLMTDIADYQIGLMNLASSDLMYAMKSNFPFYTEQYYPQAEHLAIRQADAKDTDEQPGTAVAASQAADKEIKVGATKGRRYAKGLERPGFVHPSSEPLLASIKKQEQMIQEIRQLINLNLTNVEPRRASAEAKAFDERGLESGLSFIGLELEYMEREVARIWAEYENRSKPTPASIYYPKNYSLRTEADRQAEAELKIKQASKIPSNTYRKQTMMEVVDLTMGTKVDEITLEKMKAEVQKADVVIVDPDVIRADVEEGICSKETASKARGYPEGDVDKANKEHAERAKIIAISQSEGAGAAARGVDDMDPDGTKGAKDEKKNNAGQQQ